MLRLLRPPADAQRREWWWLACVGLLAGLLLAAGLWLERERIAAREQALLAQQAAVLHDNLGEQLEAINNALGNLVAEVQKGASSLDERQRLTTRMRNFADAMPTVRNFMLLDQRGRVLAATAEDILGRDLGEREYFQTALHSTRQDALVVGRPFYGMLNGWVIVLGRSVPGPDGGFAGLLAAALDVQHFQTLLQSVRYAPDMRVSLSHGDGLRVMALGADNEPEGVNLAQPGTLFTRHGDSGQAASVLQGMPQPGYPPYLMALRTVQPQLLHMNKPLVVAAGRSLHEVLADWRLQAWRFALVYLLVGVVASAGLRLMHRRQNEARAQAQRLEAGQRGQREMLHRLVENLPGLLYQYQLEPDGRSHFPYASPGVADIYGHTPEQLQADAAPVFARIHPADLQPGMADIEQSARTLTDWKSEYRVILPGRGERWLSGQARPQRLDGGAVLWHGYIHDITEAKQQALQLQDTERVLQHLMNEMPIGLCMVDARHRIYFRNRRFLQDFGHAEAAAPTLHEWSLQAYPDPAYRQQVGSVWKDAVAQARAGDGQIPLRDYRINAHDGTQRVVAIGGLVFGEHFLATFQDHTERQAQSEFLHRLAYLDGLTELANRRQFDQALQAEWRRCRRSSTPLAVLLLDVDYFKQYNDLYGHPAGDACLQAVAGVLQAGLSRASDLVARYGGEEFVCLLPECSADGALQKARALCRAVQALGLPHAGSGVAEVVTISIGVACQVPGADGSPEALLQQADAQLYRAKTAGRNRALAADPEPAGA
ncbi:MAG: diguanylate cyclase [Proteobacteria bacterium]|nr:diguanylate cyclase [Pseudomonadota bacterium]MBS0493174.1 diguanylate cyclase [Pseudomonadota bacterium]